MEDNLACKYNMICREEYRGRAEEKREGWGGACTRGQTHKRQADQGGWPGRPQPTNETRWLKMAQDGSREKVVWLQGPVWMPVQVVVVVAGEGRERKASLHGV
jgi:hypothetical protein